MNYNFDKFEILEDGRLKIFARIFKEGIYSISPEELNVSSDKDNLQIFYNLETFFTPSICEKIKTAPIVIDHQTVSAENPEGICGNVVGEPYLSDKFVECQIVINKKEVIDSILAKNLREMSPKFKVKTILNAGIYDNKLYDGYIDVLDVEHISLLPPQKGRQGQEVSLLNSGSISAEKKENFLNNGEEILTDDIEISELRKKFDEASNTIKALSEENESLRKSLSDEEILKKFNEIEATKSKAKEILSFHKLAIDGIDNMSMTNLKKEVLKNIDSDFDLTSCEDAALNAAFNFAHKSTLKAMAEAKNLKDMPAASISVVENAAHVKSVEGSGRFMTQWERNAAYDRCMAQALKEEA